MLWLLESYSIKKLGFYKPKTRKSRGLKKKYKLEFLKLRLWF